MVVNKFFNSHVNFCKNAMFSPSSIGALAKNREGHVPYRDSKLTHMLQHSLGGDSKALMFCNVSPVECSLNESLTSLWFAQKVNKVERK